MRNERGFTLIELILTVGLIAVITAFSAIFYARFLTQNAVLNTTDQLTGQLRKAQIYAMAGKQNGNWGVNYASQTITLYLGNSYAGRTAAFDESFTVNNNIAVSGISDLNFARITGIPSLTPTITISGNNNTKTITVNNQGMINR